MKTNVECICFIDILHYKYLALTRFERDNNCEYHSEEGCSILNNKAIDHHHFHNNNNMMAIDP